MMTQGAIGGEGLSMSRNQRGPRAVAIAFLCLFTSALFLSSGAHARPQRGDPIVVRVIQLDYADAEELASVLAPLVSVHGRIVAYSRTNSLIIMDRASVVKRLMEIIKGPIDKQP
jgi:type II secretory pathway component GspD/PulD (secretin)